MLLHLNILFFLFAKALGTFLFYSDTQNKQITPKIFCVLIYLLIYRLPVSAWFSWLCFY